MLGSTIVPTFDALLPTSQSKISSFEIIVQVRDKFNAVTEVNITTVSVVQDSINVDYFIKLLNSSSTNVSSVFKKNPFINFLNKNNSITTAQVITTVTQLLNQMNTESIKLNAESKQLNCSL